jgi:hypothetical protein
MDESCRFFEWIVRVAGVCREEDHVPVVFGVEGERDLTEHTLDHLAGYRGSRPVRVGNGAWTQRQLDVLGEVADCAFQLRDDIEFDPFTVEFPCRPVNRAAKNWRNSDMGSCIAGRTTRRARSCPRRSGWPSATPAPAGASAPRTSSRARARTPMTSACCPRRPTREPARRWAISPKALSHVALVNAADALR